MSTQGTVESGTIYTPGYSQRKAASTLERLLSHPQTLLLYVRSHPVSHWKPEWNRAELAACYGEHYRWEPRPGNVNEWSRDRAIQLLAGSLEAVSAAAALICMGTSLVLLCACGDERTCHQSIVARLIQDLLPAPTTAEEM